MDYLVRAPTAADLEVVAGKINGCFQGAALQTGCKVNIEREILMFELRNDKALAVSPCPTAEGWLLARECARRGGQH